MGIDGVMADVSCATVVSAEVGAVVTSVTGMADEVIGAGVAGGGIIDMGTVGSAGGAAVEGLAPGASVVVRTLWALVRTAGAVVSNEAGVDVLAPIAEVVGGVDDVVIPDEFSGAVVSADVGPGV